MRVPNGKDYYKAARKNLKLSNHLKRALLHENRPEYGAHFNMIGFARKHVWKQRQKATQKWPNMISGLFNN